ncbi:CNNM domain-containing protein [Cytobacillus oceanisediminis]|uniref:CNNM domain-containing protein n=1 Tax=Cytobacillus oceanisediminis TaxID=665099 RepID=UPI00203A8767|nr:CNNM domain-containing protein [Cytobacillus oceanisediminis]MCM3402533.1 CNNM domain-containing protein [Cytobacillus oceanisediminis]MDK7667466.1 CNNM domain-containing protein [Cytobacillus oceanisediminis]
MFIAIMFFMFMSFFLSGSETALTAVNKMKLKSRADNNDKKSQRILEVVSKPDEMITSILIGNNIANIMLPTLVTIIALDYGFNVGVATGILTVALILFAEVLPKSVAASFADKIAYLVFPVIRVIMIILKPVTFLISKFTRGIIKFLSKNQADSVSVSKEELITMVDIATSEGTFHEEETQRIKGIIDFYNLDVSDALKTPRMEIEGIPYDATIEEAKDIVMNNRFTRYPVYKDNMDNIVGVFHSKILLAWSSKPEKTLKDFTDLEPLFVYEFHSIDKVFKMMMKERKHLAIVLDEYGGTKGIISHEDILEAMLGQEIEDETDEGSEILIDELTENHIIVHAKLSIRRINEAFKTKIPEDEDILAGFLLKEIGHFPAEGETLDYHHLHFEIKSIEDNRLKLVEIKKKTP